MTCTRRAMLRGAAVATAAAAPTVADRTAAQSGSGLDSWFQNTSNYDGVVDETGQKEVTVEVGTLGNDGNFAFGPAAVRVDPGTKVVWKWTGKGGSHNVVAEGGAFESKLTGEQGHTFSHEFEEKGVFKYACVPHKAMGMKGAIVVGDAATGGSRDGASSSSDGESSSSASSGGEPSGASSSSSEDAASAGGRPTEDYLVLGFGGALVAALLGLPVAEVRKRRRKS